MIIIAVVTSDMEYLELEDNSFEAARKIGFKTYLVKPSKLSLAKSSCDKEIGVSHFSGYGEANVAQACSTIFDNEFLLHVDPDEFYSHVLLKQIAQFVTSLEDDQIGLVKMRYYFKGKMLHGTPWGGERLFTRIAKPQVFQKRVNVHGRLDGQGIEVPTELYAKHFWANSFDEISIKHRRYLKSEGAAKFALNGKFVLRESFFRLLRVHFGILKRLNYRDGLNGLLLSLIFSNYAIRSENELRKYSSSITK